MKFTFSWLKDYLETDYSLEEIVNSLNAIGFEVEGVDDKAYMKPFITAKIVEAEKHPQADRLKILKVDIGEAELVQVVCGASNARQGLIGVLAKPGTYVPGLDVVLSVAKIRGETSYGMMCSESELCLPSTHDGIIQLSEDVPVGIAFAEHMGLDDPVIDISVTVNRPDAAGVYGIARDLAAAGVGVLRVVQESKIKANHPCPISIHVDEKSVGEKCRSIAIRSIKGVQNKASPSWLKRRLEAIGVRSINALVDITNYMTFTYSRPMHVFDADKLCDALIVRHAKDGEKISTLHHKEHILSSNICVLADDRGPVSIAGIIGSAESGCDENTKNVVLEAAVWEPLDIARAGRALKITTDARYRYERGVDPSFLLPSLDIATDMILNICAGEPSEVFCCGSKSFLAPEVRKISFPVKEVSRLSGLDIEKEEMINILKKLGFSLQEEVDGCINVFPPSWRCDIKEKADIVGEIIRIYGVDHIKSEQLVDYGISQAVSPREKGENIASAARLALASQGMIEVLTWSFIPEKYALFFGGGNPPLILENPISRDMSYMRPSLLPGLLTSAENNARHGIVDVGLFEVSCIYRKSEEIEQCLSAAGVRRGHAGLGRQKRSWFEADRAVSVFDAKADVLALLASYGIEEDEISINNQDIPSWFHPKKAAKVEHKQGVVLGFFGEFHPKTFEMLDLSGFIAGFEIYIDKLAPFVRNNFCSKRNIEIYPLQPITRDFCFIVDKTITSDKIIAAAMAANKELITKAYVFDIFEDDSLGIDKKSVAIEVTMQPKEKALLDKEIHDLSALLIESVFKKTQATLR